MFLNKSLGSERMPFQRALHSACCAWLTAHAVYVVALFFRTHSSSFYSLYKPFQAVSCWNLSTGRLQKAKPIVNANTCSCAVWPMDFNAAKGTEHV